MITALVKGFIIALPTPVKKAFFNLIIMPAFYRAGYAQLTEVISKNGYKGNNGVVKITILIDKYSLEVFGNDGEKVISTIS